MSDMPELVMAPGCGACGAAAVVQWRRRPTAAELAVLVALEEGRRDELRALATPEQPPVFGPLPGAGDFTVAVYACGQHAIALEAAAQVHQAECNAPHEAHLPGCSCTPEPLPTPDPPRESRQVTLPTGWQLLT
jgi:hypothetical protein